jgi:hypothetical protein
MAPAPVQPAPHHPAPPAAPGLPTVAPPSAGIDPYGLLPTESAAAAFAAIQAPPQPNHDVHAALPPQAEIDQALASLYGEVPEAPKHGGKRAKKEKKEKTSGAGGSKLPRWLAWAKRTKSASDPTTAERTCPSCGGEARVDIYDPWRGLLHMSCDACFRMWQEVEMPEIPALETADGKKRKK